MAKILTEIEQTIKELEDVIRQGKFLKQKGWLQEFSEKILFVIAEYKKLVKVEEK